MNQDPILTALKERFGFTDWVNTNLLDEELFVRDFILAPFLDEGWEPIRVTRTGDAATGRSTHTLCRRGRADDALLRVDVVESPTRRAAHEQLTRFLGHFQSTDMERQQSDPVGDVSFASPGARAIVLARANLAILVVSTGARALDVPEIAYSLDERIRAWPDTDALMNAVLADGITLTGRQGLRLEVGRPAVSSDAHDTGHDTGVVPRDATVPVRVFQESEPDEDPQVLKFCAHDAEIRSDGEGVALIPNAAGRNRLTVYGVTREGDVSTDSVVIDVD